MMNYDLYYIWIIFWPLRKNPWNSIILRVQIQSTNTVELSSAWGWNTVGKITPVEDN